MINFKGVIQDLMRRRQELSLLEEKMNLNHLFEENEMNIIVLWDTNENSLLGF